MKERLEDFINSATNAIVLFDSELNITHMNEIHMEMFHPGMDKEDLIGKNLLEVVPNLKETGRFKDFIEVMETGSPFYAKDIIPHKKFGNRHLSVKAFKIADGLGTIIMDITERKLAEEALRKAHEELEHKVKERTLKLHNALKAIQENKKKLTERKFALEKLNSELLETNKALGILARNIDRDKDLLKKNIYEIISTNIMPIIKELQNDKRCLKRLPDFELLKTYLNDLVPDLTDTHEIVVILSSSEMRVAAMIKSGMTSPKIAEMLNISLHTVKSHRKNIRKKLKLQNSNINLTSYLKAKFRE